MGEALFYLLGMVVGAAVWEIYGAEVKAHFSQ